MFATLIDYAGLFPPAHLAMQEAVAEYIVERRGRYSWMLGRFIVPHSRIPELRATVDTTDRFSLSVILDRGMESLENIAHRLHGESPLRIEALEIVLAPLRIAAFAETQARLELAGVPSFVEFERDPEWERTLPRAMESLAASSLGAKIRCGGLSADAFPTPREVAAFIYFACRQGVPFKATAGLHHPIRHFDKSIGVYRHGFLNLIAAAAIARSGVDVDVLTKIVACEDRSQFRIDESGLAFGERRAGVAELGAMRREGFTSYGSCSFSEPVDDMRNLNLLP